MPPVAVSLRWHYPRPVWHPHRIQPPSLRPHRHLPLFPCPLGTHTPCLAFVMCKNAPLLALVSLIIPI